MEQRNYEKDLPLKPSEDVIRWMQEKKGCFKKHMLLYQSALVLEPLSGMKRKAARLDCSACGATVYAERVESQSCCAGYTSAPFGFFHPGTKEPVISGHDTTCPECGAKVEVQHMRDGRKVCWDSAGDWVMTVERCGDRLALLGWIVKKQILRDRETGKLREEIWAGPYEAYVFEEKKAVYLRGYDKFFSRVTLHDCWEQKDRCYDDWGDSKIYPWDKRLLVGSTCENSKLDRYIKAAGEKALPVSYLRLWQKRKAVENLVVQGAGALLHELIHLEAHSSYYGYHAAIPKLERINWKEKRPAQMLGLTREEFRHCVAEKWDKVTWAFYLDCKKEGVHLALPEDLALCRQIGIYGANRLLKEGRPLLPTARYLAKQRAEVHTLDDYWRMAKEEGYDLNLRQVRWPKDLKKAHDRVLEEQQARRKAERDAKEREKNRQLKAAFREQYEEIRWMQFSKGGLLIRPCESPEELDKEGRTLSHCVANYKNKHAEGRSAIFFIRRAAEPDKPWYTLELDVKNLQVIQNRGKSNCDRTAQVQKFEDEWLAYIRAAAAKREKKGRKKSA